MDNNFFSSNFKEISVKIPLDNSNFIEGNLSIVTISNSSGSNGIVVFAHGSGSSRHSLRNKFVAKCINNEGISTLLVDLLTKQEDIVDSHTREFRFNIPLLVNRLIIATNYILNFNNQNQIKENVFFYFKKIGFFGASTGAAASLIAADRLPRDKISAIVSRGGRVDLATGYTSLKKIQCPCLLIVGEKDYSVIEWNKQILDTHLPNVDEKQMVIIPGASHLFEEKGKLEEVAKYSTSWFKKYL